VSKYPNSLHKQVEGLCSVDELGIGVKVKHIP
jgi:hypothetical protein